MSLLEMKMAHGRGERGAWAGERRTGVVHRQDRRAVPSEVRQCRDDGWGG